MKSECCEPLHAVGGFDILAIIFVLFHREMSDVLEKEHHISPTFLMMPGATLEKDCSRYSSLHST